MRFNLELDNKIFEIAVSKTPDLTITLDGESISPRIRETKRGFQVQIGRKWFSIGREGDTLNVNGEPRRVSVRSIDFVSEIAPPKEEAKEAPEELSKLPEDRRGAIYPPMPGRVVSISVREGAKLRVGSPLLILEAMKMQNEVSSPLEGVVREIKVKPGDLVDVGDVMVLIEQT
jgi:biotin carboxyl carrier protein